MRKSGLHGRGVFATQNSAADVVVGAFPSKRGCSHELPCDKSYTLQLTNRKGDGYLDASAYRDSPAEELRQVGIAHLVNCSARGCENAFFACAAGKTRMYAVLTQNVEPGDEVLADYHHMVAPLRCRQGTHQRSECRESNT